MRPDFYYTKHQTPRGTMPDAEVGNVLYLIKNVSEMRLTYQVRLLTYMASSKGKKLHIKLPSSAKLHSSLRDFVREHVGLLKIERV
jgi:hypothetical protein